MGGYLCGGKPIPLPRDRVRFVTDACGYVFLQWWIAVTTDAGSRWTVWNAPAHLPGKVHYHLNLIRSVDIAPDGTGAMVLGPEGVVDGRTLRLRTQSFGRDWTEGD